MIATAAPRWRTPTPNPRVERFHNQIRAVTGEMTKSLVVGQFVLAESEALYGAFGRFDVATQT